jgi:hypothetical protein
MVRLRLEPDDESMHDTEGVSNFNDEYLDQIVDGAPVGVAEEDGA